MQKNLKTLLSERSNEILKNGFAFGINIPQQRSAPLCPPQSDSTLIIAEINHTFLSKNNNPIATTSYYLDRGANIIAISAQDGFFKESITYLMQIKNTFKKSTILRKDWIKSPEEIEVSYKIGADMVWLSIATFINQIDIFETILQEIEKYQITPIFQIQNLEEFNFLKPYNPQFISLALDSLNNHQDIFILKQKISSISNEIKIIFQSHINNNHDGYLIGANGFDGIFFNIINQTTPLPNLIKSYKKGTKQTNIFYQKLFNNLAFKNKPLIKICGITNIDDAISCAQMGADMIGYILSAKNPKYIDNKTIKQISKALKTLYPDVLLIGVICEDSLELKNAKELLGQNILDALQLQMPSNPPHFANQNLTQADFNFYLSTTIEKYTSLQESYTPFILLDSINKSPNLEKLKTFKQLFVAIQNERDLSGLLEFDIAMLDIDITKENDARKKDLEKINQIIYKIKDCSKITKY